MQLPVGTLGGKQFWTDELVHGSLADPDEMCCRVISDCLTPDNKRRAWGTWEHCQDQWKTSGRANTIPPLKPKVVLVLHGLGRTRSSMADLVEYLTKHGTYEVLNIAYASTRVPLSEDAKSLARWSAAWRAWKRSTLSPTAWATWWCAISCTISWWPRAGWAIDPAHPPVRHAGPAEQRRCAGRDGSSTIRSFASCSARAASSSRSNGNELREHLATPPCPFGIIAGGAADGSGRNPMLEGDDDMVVTVEETRLPGAADFVIVPAVHTFIMDDPRVQEYTLRFLQHGYFIAEEARQPIPAEPPKPDDVP